MVETMLHLNTLAGPALAEVLETMAFVCALPVEPQAIERVPKPPIILLTMRFAGTISGAVTLMAPESFGETLAANMVGEQLVPTTRQMRHDALSELLNMTCGVLFRNATATSPSRFEIALPHVRECDDENAWTKFASQPGATFFDCEGTTVAIRVVEDSE